MKRMIVILALLTTASIANAALTLYISGPEWALPGTSVTFTVGYSGATMLSSDVDIVADCGIISNGVILTTNRDPILDIVGSNTATANYEVSITNDVAGVDLLSPLFSFQWTAPPIFEVAHITLLENSFFDLEWNQIMGTQMPVKMVTNIPEPMTMILLSLGGLFLRNHRR